jgi:hypothetical protein
VMSGKANTELTLLCMRANVPNAALFAAKTDRELALLAVKHGVELPRHLAHLPSTPPPKSAEEKEEIAHANQAEEEDLIGRQPEKERPHRRGRLVLQSATDVVSNIRRSFRGGEPAAAPGPAAAQPKRARARAKLKKKAETSAEDAATGDSPPPSHRTMESQLVDGSVSKDGPGRSRRAKKGNLLGQGRAKGSLKL